MNSSEQREFWSFWCTSIQRRYSKFQEIEELFHTTLEEVTNIKLSGHSWIQASTPVSSGCIGLRKLGDLSCPVYFSSLHQSHDLSNKILAKFNVDIMMNELSDKIRQFPSNSKDKTNFWEFVIFRYYYARILASFNTETSKWLQVIPSSRLGLLLDDNSSRIAVALRLGCIYRKIDEEHTCVFGDVV